MARASLLRRFGRGVLRLVLWLVGLAAVAVVGLWGYFRFDFARAAETLPGLEERAKALRLPLTPEEMRRKPAVSPSENAAPLYSQAAEEFKKHRIDREICTAIRLGASGPNVEGLGEAIRLMRGFEPALNLATSASKKPHADFGVKWEEGPFAQFGPYSTLKDSAKYLVYRGLIRIRSGEVDAGLDDLANAARIANHAGEGRALLGLLVYIAIEAIVMNGYQFAATELSENRQALDRMGRDISAMPAAQDFELAMKAEAFENYYLSREFHRFFDRIAREWGDGEGSDFACIGPIPDIVFFPPFIDRSLVCRAYAARALEYWVEAFEDLPSGPRGRRELVLRLEASVSRLQSELRPSGLIGRNFFSIAALSEMNYTKSLAQRASTAGLVAVLQFRLAHGRLPKTLSEAGFEQADPFGSGPLRMIRTERGFRVYSVGDDGRDDLGLDRYEAQVKAKGDFYDSEGVPRAGWDVPSIFPAWDKEGWRP